MGAEIPHALPALDGQVQRLNSVDESPLASDETLCARLGIDVLKRRQGEQRAVAGGFWQRPHAAILSQQGNACDVLAHDRTSRAASMASAMA